MITTTRVDEGFWGVKLDAYITDNHHLEYTAFSDERDGVEAVYAFDGAYANTRRVCW